MSPDPYDGSYHMRNPQSLNRYNYALNNPMSFVDPSGLYCEYPHGDDSVWDGKPLDDVDYDSPGESFCESDGGTWFPDAGTGSAGGGADTSGDTGGAFGDGPGSGTGSGSGSGAGGSSGAPGPPAPNNSLPVPVHGLWHYGNYCGAGGMGTPTNAVDQACEIHDSCFASTGADWTNMQSEANFNQLNPGQQHAVQSCNQQLCNAMGNIYPQIPSWNVSQSVADLEIQWYFQSFVPQGAQCHQ